MKDGRWKMKDERFIIKIYCMMMMLPLGDLLYDDDLLYIDEKIYCMMKERFMIIIYCMLMMLPLGDLLHDERKKER
jgi:hypothetical protein